MMANTPIERPSDIWALNNPTTNGLIAATPRQKL
jgi:hypothetical protein